MWDYRLPAHRPAYFEMLYELNLRRRIMPGLVYLYMPELARRYAWAAEDKLWFAFLNGMTQNPITSLRLLEQLPAVPAPAQSLTAFTSWFNAQWPSLQFDIDRRYQKRETPQAIQAYARLVAQHGSQERMLTGKPFADLWALVTQHYHSFGRLSAFSYLEYVHLNGYGAACDDMKFSDKDGSRSHRNGMLLLQGQDEWVWDQRMGNGFGGDYPDLAGLGARLQAAAESWLADFQAAHPGTPNAGQFTLESNLCTFKNHFFGRRYPGVYADMAWERIEWADARGQGRFTKPFKEMRAEHLPRWLRAECEMRRLSAAQKAAYFPATGQPFRAAYFLKDDPCA